jgi:hypothetical protein
MTTLGQIQIAVRTLKADGTFRDERLVIPAVEWRQDSGALLERVAEMIDRAEQAADEAARLANHAAGPKGRLP